MSCNYIRSRYGTPSLEPGVSAPYAAQEALDEYYTPGRVSRSSSTYEVYNVNGEGKT